MGVVVGLVFVPGMLVVVRPVLPGVLVPVAGLPGMVVGMLVLVLVPVAVGMGVLVDVLALPRMLVLMLVFVDMVVAVLVLVLVVTLHDGPPVVSVRIYPSGGASIVGMKDSCVARHGGKKA
jgi:hypothetical protein